MKQCYVVFMALAIALTGCQRKEYIAPTSTNTTVTPEVTASFNSTSAVNVHALGIYGDGKTDVSNRIQEAMNKYSALFFPSGNYLVSKTLLLNYKQSITGTAHTTFVMLNSTYFNNDEGYFFSADAIDEVRLSQLSFTGINNANKAYYAVLINNSSNVSVSKVTCRYCGIVRSKFNNLPYASIVSGNYKLNTNLTVDSCSGQGSNGRGMGVYIEYISHFKISHTALSHYYHGIEWWGGDSNPQRDGELNKRRMVSHGEISDVTINHINQGGIWGSMGDSIAVRNCKVTNCGDVGIDFEGCFNSKAIYNTVSNCNNGCLATFYFNKGIAFTANTVTQDDPNAPMACIYNASQSQQNKDITFSNNTFRANTGVGIITQLGPADTILFADNKLQNVVLNLAFNNNRRVHITGNQINITAQSANHNFIIKGGDTNSGGILTIDNNTITNSTSSNKAVYGIYATQTDYNSQPVNYITNNEITGVKARYKLEWNGMNAGITCKTYLRSASVIDQADVVKTDNGNSRSELYINGIKQ